MMKKSKGITLVALVVTIIVLLILAGVSLNLIMGNEGILGKTEVAVNETQKQIATELIDLKINSKVIDSYEENGRMPTLEELALFLSADDEVEYVELESIASAEPSRFAGADEIFTKLKEYPYEFQLNEDCEIVNVKPTETLANKPENKPEDEEKLPENTPETEAGTEVALKEGWATETMRYVNVDTGKEVTGLTQVATVYAVSDGQGNTVPVPLGFYYVGGTLDSGVVISDNEADKNKYAGDVNGAVGIDLEGNQFVWIPCESSNYAKTNWGQGNVANRSNSCWDTTTPGLEIAQIEKYGGYYVARYESGLDLSKAHTTEKKWDDNYHDGETSKPQSKAGLLPWNWVSWNTSKARAEEMYNNNYVQSGLITGTQWDVMINTINAKTGASLTDSQWGNYDNTSITYTGAGATYNESAGTLGTFTGTSGTTNSSTASGSKTLLYTGSSNQCMKYNLYDVAGNMWEWTEETSFYGGNTEAQYRVLRGNSCHGVSSSPVCYRNGNSMTSDTNYHVGFRVVLYMK